jgi:hypothetical protein
MDRMGRDAARAEESMGREAGNRSLAVLFHVYSHIGGSLSHVHVETDAEIPAENGSAIEGGIRQREGRV